VACLGHIQTTARLEALSKKKKEDPGERDDLATMTSNSSGCGDDDGERELWETEWACSIGRRDLQWELSMAWTMARTWVRGSAQSQMR
jgi:hypothetical protein